jgi:hypothetical protein
LFIPESVYTISKTIYLPVSIRPIGYGKKVCYPCLKRIPPEIKPEYYYVPERPSTIISGWKGMADTFH